LNIPTPDQALLAFPHFSEVAAHGGGTLLLEGSHTLSTRFFRDISADGRHRLRGAAMRGAFEKSHPWLAQLCGHLRYEGDRIRRFMEEGDEIDGVYVRVTEIVAQAGDVFLCHPFLYHARSQNHSARARFMCNGRVQAAQPHPMVTETALGVTLKRALHFPPVSGDAHGTPPLRP
jgi:ectoine hydroxylase-related dioxygenase (phytanoyl-CoA dioxygenase family)